MELQPSRYSEIQIEPYTEQHRASVIELLAMGERDLEGVASRFSWKYERNPFFEKPYAYVALHQGKVVGFRGFFALPFALGDRRVTVLCPADAFVHRDYRRRGLFTAMTQSAIRHIETLNKSHVFLNLSSNQFSSPGYLKMGWQAVTNKTVGAVIGVSGFVNQFFKRVLSRKVVLAPGGLDRWLYKLVAQRPATAIPIEIGKQPRPEAMSILSQQTGSRDRLCAVRTAEYYAWRFSNHYRQYRFAYLWDNEDLVAFAVLAKDEMGYLLADYGYAVPGTLHMLLFSFLNSISFSQVTAWIFGMPEPDISELTKAGFMTGWLFRRVSGFQTLPYLVRPAVASLAEKDWVINGLDIRRAESWYIAPVDSDTA